jgi:hypothetical protein
MPPGIRNAHKFTIAPPRDHAVLQLLILQMSGCLCFKSLLIGWRGPWRLLFP